MAVRGAMAAISLPKLALTSQHSRLPPLVGASRTRNWGCGPCCGRPWRPCCCFFSAHVLEHVPSPSKSFDYAMRLLKPSGLFVSFTPNGSEAHRAASPDWSRAWGGVHPQFIDEKFLDHSFKLSPRAVGPSPVGDISLPAECRLEQADNLAGFELVFIARKTGDAWA